MYHLCSKQDEKYNMADCKAKELFVQHLFAPNSTNSLVQGFATKSLKLP